MISDDATSGLDVTVQAQVLELIRKLVSERGASMIFITRDIGITAHHCHRIAIIYAGEIVEIAERQMFFDDPQHPYTILLLAAFAQNERLRRYWLGEERLRENVEPQPGGLSVPEPLRACTGALPHRPSRAARAQSGDCRRCHFPVVRS